MHTASTSSESYVSPPHDGDFPVATLSNGDVLPMVGLGCASGVGKGHVLSALGVGYRYLDTAQSYQWGYREDEVGDAVRDSPVDRDDVYVQSKIHPEDLGYNATRRAFLKSLERLKMFRVDSMLIHKPRCWEGACHKVPEGTWRDSWRALEDLRDEGLVSSIGICDVDDGILDELLTQRVRPHIIQNWMDPFHQDVRIRERCREEGIQYQAYSSLGSQWAHHMGHGQNPVMNDATLRSIADTHNVDVAQVVINWATRHGIAVVPASTNLGRQRSNLDSFHFDLTDKEMRAIDALDGKAERKAQRLDPDKVSLVFENKGLGRVKSFWVESSSGEEILVGEIDTYGEMALDSYHGHSFVFRDGEGALVGQHTVAKHKGRQQRHVVADGEL